MTVRSSAWIVPTLLFLCCVPDAISQRISIRDFKPKEGHPRSNTGPGDTVLVFGTNFSPNENAQAAYFGTVRTRTISPTISNDTMRLEPGLGATYEPISITSIASRTTTFTRLPFRYISSASSKGFQKKRRIGPGRFVAAGVFTPGAPNAVDLVASVVDSNGQDFLATYANLNNGTAIPFSGFGRVSLSAMARGSMHVARADFDGDAGFDVAMTANASGASRLVLFRNSYRFTGTVRFDSTLELPLPGRSSAIAVHDLDEDGFVDIAISMADSNMILILKNTSPALGEFRFVNVLRLVTQGLFAGIAIGDVNGDALPEIVATETNLDQVVVFRNDGGMNFTPLRFSCGVQPTSIRLADIDADTSLDIVVTNPSNGVMTVRLNTTRSLTSITFGPEHRVEAGGTDIANFDIHDLDADGRLDIVVTNHERNSISILTSTTNIRGTVSFAPTVEYAVGRGPRNVVICDYDKDGYNDIAVAGDPDTCAEGDCDRFSDLIILRGRNAVASFSADKNALTVTGALIGGIGTDTIFVTNNAPSTVSSTLDITALVNSSRFRVSPADIQSIAVGQRVAFVVTYAPQDTTLRRDTLTFTHTAPGSPIRIPLSGKGLSSVAAPILVTPAANTANIEPAQCRFSWSRVASASRYHFRAALDATFENLIADKFTTDTTTTVNPIAFNTKYYWHVASSDANGDGLYSPMQSFTTSSVATISGQVLFPENPSADTSYRLVSVPSASRLSVGDILSGSQNTDWRIFRENGEPPPNDLTELSASDQLKVGEGYLMLRKGVFNFSRSVIMPPIEVTGTFSIPVEKRWIVIGNPFEREIKWRSVLTANNLTARTLYTYQGSRGIQPDSTLQPFVGYLFDNSNGVDTLRFPYPFSLAATQSPPSIPISWKLQLIVESEGKFDKENFIGISPHAKTERDELEEHKPPIFLNKGTISFSRPRWDGANPLFASDYRPALGDGQVWEFDARNERLVNAAIRVIGCENVSPEFDIVLVNQQNSLPFDLRQNSKYEFQTVSERMSFRLIVGRRSFVENEIRISTPKEFHLAQNYPNPFNPSTSIEFSVPRESNVKLEIVSVLGERVAVLADTRYQTGTYTVVWSPSSGAATGIYFCRFLVDGKPIALRKMLLLK